MAQTRKRRQTKHRGNAAGMVEARGRTGRRPGEGEKGKLTAKEEARQRRMSRLDRPPTWRGSVNRAAIAALLFGVVIIIMGQQPAAAFSLAALMLLIYIPMSYYTDLFVYRRRQKMKAQAKAKKAQEKA